MPLPHAVWPLLIGRFPTIRHIQTSAVWCVDCHRSFYFLFCSSNQLIEFILKLFQKSYWLKIDWVYFRTKTPGKWTILTIFARGRWKTISAHCAKCQRERLLRVSSALLSPLLQNREATQRSMSTWNIKMSLLVELCGIISLKQRIYNEISGMTESEALTNDAFKCTSKITGFFALYPLRIAFLLSYLSVV